jgi:hypothetical protein
VIGLAGVMYQIETPEEQERAFCELLPVIRHIDKSYDSLSLRLSLSLQPACSSCFDLLLHS